MTVTINFKSIMRFLAVALLGGFLFGPAIVFWYNTSQQLRSTKSGQPVVVSANVLRLVNGSKEFLLAVDQSGQLVQLSPGSQESAPATSPTTK